VSAPADSAQHHAELRRRVLAEAYAFALSVARRTPQQLEAVPVAETVEAADRGNEDRQ
jgi:hypothetical protein